MKNKMKVICAAVMALQVSYGVQADVLELKNKSILEGNYVGGTSDTIRFQVGADTKVIPTGEIMALTFTGANSKAGASSQPAPNSGATGAAVGVAAGGAAAAAGSQSAAASTPVTIPAGTELAVVMDNGVDSSRDSVGTRFTGKLQKDVVVNGQVAIPTGSMVAGQLNQAKEAGRLAGQSMLGLTLTSITLHGQQLPLATEDVTLAGSQEGRKTARRAGAGAAIGALANGGEGAAKGAAIGGAASMGKGDAAAVPPGAVVPFRLKQPITLGGAAGS